MMKKFLLMCGMVMAALTMPLTANYCGTDCDPCCDDVGFNGFYVGGNIGVFTHTAMRNDFGGFIVEDSPFGWSYNQTDVTLGVQLGYDWLCCYKLFGLVVDWNWVNVDRRSDFFTAEEEEFFGRHSWNWFTTIRARAGLAVSDALVYVTAGAAVSNFDGRFSSDGTFLDNNHTRWGWVGGVGTELILGCNWSVGLEVLFLQFAERTRTFLVDDVPFAFGHSDAGYLARFLLNYRFGDLCGCW